MDFVKSHPFLDAYLRYVENTESPRIFHIWSALSGISACMGRRCWYPMGTGEVWPNMFVVLVGQPAVRKSTAFKIASSLLRKNTKVRFAPDDTGGQRQGFIAAMNDIGDDDDETEKALVDALSDLGTDTIAGLSRDNGLEKLAAIELDSRDPRTMYVAASELNSILGENNTALLTFFCKMWDGDPYEYKLKSTSHRLSDALLGIIGATTPSQISIALPAEAIGGGFTSRVVFVYADVKHARRIARPSLDQRAELELGAMYAKVFHEFEGPFAEDPIAAANLDAIYDRGIVLPDPRFVHYADRRHTHLQKLCMSLAASRGEMVIRDIDVKLADQLLMVTEEHMADALGEYGMNKLGAAKQRLLDFIRHSDGPIPMSGLYGLMSRDMSQMDFRNVLAELHNTRKITITSLPDIGQCVIAVSDKPARTARKELSAISELLKTA